MEAEMKMVFQQKVQEKEQKLKQSEEELYARHREMKEALDKQRLELEDKKRRIESGRPLTPEKGSVSLSHHRLFRRLMPNRRNDLVSASDKLCLNSRNIYHGRYQTTIPFPLYTLRHLCYPRITTMGLTTALAL